MCVQECLWRSFASRSCGCGCGCECVCVLFLCVCATTSSMCVSWPTYPVMYIHLNIHIPQYICTYTKLHMCMYMCVWACVEEYCVEVCHIFSVVDISIYIQWCLFYMALLQKRPIILSYDMEKCCVEVRHIVSDVCISIHIQPYCLIYLYLYIYSDIVSWYWSRLLEFIGLFCKRAL